MRSITETLTDNPFVALSPLTEAHHAWARANPGYVPTRLSAGRDFANAFELALWRVVRGFGPISEFIEAFGQSTLLVVLPEDDPTGER